MRACKSLIRAKKGRQEELKEKIRYLEKEVQHLYEDMYELHQRVTQLEIMRKLSN